MPSKGEVGPFNGYDFGDQGEVARFDVTDDLVIEIEKVGGGEIGRRYDGKWNYRVIGSDYVIHFQGCDLECRWPMTHAEVSVALAGDLSMIDFDVDPVRAALYEYYATQSIL